MADRDVTGKTEVLGLENLVGGGVVENRLGVDASLVCERTVTAIMGMVVSTGTSCIMSVETYVIGFMKGTFTSTASATKFSISRSMGRLYLLLTYSGLAA